MSKNPYWWIFLPVPVPLAFFLILDNFGMICCINAFRKSLYKRFIVAVIIITMFVRMVSYHSGWIIFLLITYPLQVGTVILIFVTYYFTISFSFASMTVLCLRRRRNQILPVYILYIGTYTFLTFSFFLTIYYIFLAIYPHEDSITKFIPSLLPMFFIGFCSWIAKNIIFKVIDYDEENQVGHSNENLQNNNNNENPQNSNNENPQNSNNENPHESEIVNSIEDNENTPLLSGNQSTVTRRTNLSINSNT